MNADILITISGAAGALAAYCVVLLLGQLFLRNRVRIRRRLSEGFRQDRAEQSGRSELFKELHEAANDRMPSKWGLGKRLRIALEQSGLAWTLEELLWFAAGLGLASGAAGFFLAPHWTMSLPACVLGGAAPFLYAAAMQRRRSSRLCTQLPATFEMISRAVQAGQTMSTAFQLVAREGKPPISDEFAYCCEMQNLGLSQEVTLRDLASRNQVVELQMFVTAVLIQRQTGGNPVEVLNHLADIVRKRVRFAGRVRALTGEGRMQAIVLCILPPVAFAAIFVLNREYAEVLLERPKLLLGVLGLQALGAWWIRKIIHFNY